MGWGMKMTTKNKKLEKEWEGYVKKNKDLYGGAVIKVVERVCKFLDEGKSPEKAESEGIKGSGITGFQAGCMAGAIAHFHPRGNEFRKYFNKVNGGTGKEKGTINPAILTLK